MSTFHVTPNPASSPGHCLSCGKSQCAQGFVDTGATVDFYGAILFCYHCAQSLARAFSLDATAKHIIDDAAVQQVLSLNQSVENLKKEVNGNFNLLLTRVDGLVSHFSKCSNLLAEAAEVHARTYEVREDGSAEPLGFDELGDDLNL